ncbi:aspartyl-phosphate phosphatase Spo0E family protein [Clostridium botulinum C]|uniref:aspartyl-phosphate phosphatase Spo0E family protein n=1 Tax=Clostridium botulinum TaxID=1491 RepID=UPI001E303F0C|nr:aspartyl-phosphate phosphatase Spo0E family protein [Clostridium botulinum]MCD3217170.1 aspartyl-phosphate phosphatase Spo0E family protein [Clostridium botulinum C]
MKDYIKMQMEETRIKLNNLVERKLNRMIDYDVIELSQKLDRLLIQYIKITNNNKYLVKDF